MVQNTSQIQHPVLLFKGPNISFKIYHLKYFFKHQPHCSSSHSDSTSQDHPLPLPQNPVWCELLPVLLLNRLLALLGQNSPSMWCWHAPHQLPGYTPVTLYWSPVPPSFLYFSPCLLQWFHDSSIFHHTHANYTRTKGLSSRNSNSSIFKRALLSKRWENLISLKRKSLSHSLDISKS